MANIKKGDLVQVITGKKQDRGGDRGKQGHVLSVLVEQNRVIVEGVNIVARHRKPSQQNPQGGIDRFPAAMHVSKVALADPKDGKPTRVRFEVKDGKKVRVAVKSGESIDG